MVTVDRTGQVTATTTGTRPMPAMLDYIRIIADARDEDVDPDARDASTRRASLRSRIGTVVGRGRTAPSGPQDDASGPQDDASGPQDDASGLQDDASGLPDEAPALPILRDYPWRAPDRS